MTTIHDQAENLGDIAPEIGDRPKEDNHETHQETIKKKAELNELEQKVEEARESGKVKRDPTLDEDGVGEAVMEEDTLIVKQEDIFLKRNKKTPIKGWAVLKNNHYRKPYQLRYRLDQVDGLGDPIGEPLETFGNLGISKEGMTPEQGAWLIAFYNGLAKGTPSYANSLFRLIDETAKWRNKVPTSDGKGRGIANPKINYNRSSSGEDRATEVVSSALLGGAHTTGFLVHSGISVIIKPPTIGQLSILDYKIGEGNQSFGRMIKGMVGTHENTYTIRAILDLFYSCLVSTSLGTIDRTILDQNISWMDIETIAWLLACSKYPNGYSMIFPCTADPKGECDYIWSETVNTKMLWYVDETRLSEKQRDYVAKKYTHTDFEQMNAYLEEFDFSQWDTLRISDPMMDFDIEFKFVQPTIIQALASADEWEAALATASNQAFATPLYGPARDKFIETQRQISMSLNYAQFVGSILIHYRPDEDTHEEDIPPPNVIENRGSITEILGNLASNDQANAMFISKVIEFVAMSTCAMVGIPNLKCPKCGNIHEANHPDQEMKHLIKLDAIGLFIDLCQQLALPYRQQAEEESNDSTNPEKVNMRDGVEE